MGLAFKIAWRNLWRHRGKSLVIGGILFIGALLMTAGNGMISGMEKGMSDNIVNLFTGDVLVISDAQEKNEVLFDMMSGKPVKVIKNFSAAENALKKEAMIQKYLPATVGFVLVFNSGTEMGHTMLVGTDIEKYQRMFPGSFKVIEGRNLRPGETGILVGEEARKQAYDHMGFWLLPNGVKLDRAKLPTDIQTYANNLEVRHEMVIMGASESNSAMDIRVPVVGTIRYKSLNKIWGNYCVIDINSFRVAHNFVTGAETPVKITKETKKIMASDNLDDMFSSGSVVDNSQVTSSSITTDLLKAELKKEDSKINTDAGAYNVVFIKLKPGVDQKHAITELNRLFKQKKLNARAIAWKDSIGTIGSMAVIIKAALNVFIMFIFFVAIIVIMNTLSMAALERVGEIGMMRAIGARKSFLRKMFIYETGILSFFFGGLGILVGILLIFLTKAAHITTTNEILQLVYGGDQLNPLWTGVDFIVGLIELAIVTFIAVLYPLRIVGKIVPLDAIARE